MSGRDQRSPGGASLQRGPGGLIESVEPGSPCARAELRPGDGILSVDGFVLRDVLDWGWYADDVAHVLAVRDPSGAIRNVSVRRDSNEPWGVGFERAIFDSVRTCRNACTFCFMEQLPSGMRRTLSLKDDDFRLSFLDGNFITLTNFREEDVERIAQQHLSPLHVSVHAVSPQVRARLMCPYEDRALEWFDRLVEEGIDLHVQVVLVPGENDGDELERTLTWLAEREGVVSVGIVPVGSTAYTKNPSAPWTPERMRTVINAVEEWRTAMRNRDAVSWVHLADEFYLTAGLELPRSEDYDDFPQFENGIGMARSFVDDASELASDLATAAHAIAGQGSRILLVTGTLFAPVLQDIMSEHEGASVEVLPVSNDLFGGNVSVTGLLTGADLSRAVSRAVAEQDCEDARVGALVPDVILNADGLTLDDLSVEEVTSRSGVDLRVVSCDAAGLLAGLTGFAEHPPATVKR